MRGFFYARKQDVMQKILDFFTEHYTGFCIVGGGVMGFIVALLRQEQAHIKSISVCLSEAALCAFLSSAIGELAVYAFDMRPEISMFIGTFCGFLGTDYIKGFIHNYLSMRISKKDDPK